MINKTQPDLQVGIMAAGKISFELNGQFQNRENMPGKLFHAVCKDEKIRLQAENGFTRSGTSFIFQPASPEDSFLLKGVTIGIDFHWEQKEDQRFRGALKLIPENGSVRAINIIPLEEYLRSVISSEMSATSSPELLKAHAVISRSWVLAQIGKSKQQVPAPSSGDATQQSAEEMIRWYDREDHTRFDVCADDHCQRYQGITKIISEKASQAIRSTFGEVLVSGDEICDARFSKCCGGISENFENVWEPVVHSYLTRIADREARETTIPDLRGEPAADNWIRTSPPAFCNTADRQVLSQVLPGFDQSTTDFYRWKVGYTQEELSSLIREKTGTDFGQIVRLEPVERGVSARLIRLKIVGTRKTLTIGKELEIRRALSKSHLYSSAFVIDHLEEKNGIPQKLVLTGAGWGHGVGLCQIGAAMMGEKGYSYREILAHYFSNTEIKRLYIENPKDHKRREDCD